VPIFYGSDVEGLAYLTVSDEDWAAYAAAIAKAKAERDAEPDGDAA
jgi:hypothetical protein